MTRDDLAATIWHVVSAPTVDRTIAITAVTDVLATLRHARPQRGPTRNRPVKGGRGSMKGRRSRPGKRRRRST